MTYRVDKVNSWNGWDPLKQVILGNCYSPDWFRDIKDTKLKNMIQTLVRETQEDLDGIQRTLENLGVDVVRVPENTAENGENLVERGLDSYGKYLQYIEDNNKQGTKMFWKNGLPKPMITPRDYFIVFGDKFVQTTPHAGIGYLAKQNLINPDIVDPGLTNNDRVAKWKEKGFPVPGPLKFSKHAREESHPNWKQDWDTEEWAEYKNWDDQDYMDYCFGTWGFWAPMVTRIGDTLVVDIEEQANLAKYLSKKFPNYKQSRVAIGGHNDGTFCTPKPGLIINADPGLTTGFKQTFPNWDIFEIPDLNDTSEEFEKWKSFKENVDGRWWQEGADAHPTYVDFVDQWLNQWVGYVEETCFEVNMLSVSPDTILCLNKQDEVHDALKSRGISPIYTRFRHRKFWDGGLHCLTVDTVREGSPQNHFT